MNIQVSAPLLQGNEKKYLCEAIDAQEVSSHGTFVGRFEEAFAKWAGCKYSVAVCNGTAALECAVWAMKMKRIAIPNYTIISCVLAAARAGAVPAFYEGNCKEENVMRCHLFGTFNSYSEAKNIIDDASQYWQPFKVKDVATYSLYANKLITSGEGGVLVTNRRDIYEAARRYRDLCRAGDRFIHDSLAYNFRMSNLQAAVALAQLEQIDKFIEIKRRNANIYEDNLPDNVERLFRVDVPWMYLIKTDQPAGKLVDRLGQMGIECRRNFFPLNRQPCFKRLIHLTAGKYPISDELWEKTFYLPSGLTLTEKEILYVCENLRQIF